MWKVEDESEPFNIEAVITADKAEGMSHILIDVGRDSKGRAVPSLERLRRKVERCIVTDKKQVFATTKLYVFGKWNYVERNGPQDEVS